MEEGNPEEKIFETEIINRPEAMVVIRRGPLFYSIPIKEKWERVEYTENGKSTEYWLRNSSGGSSPIDLVRTIPVEQLKQNTLEKSMPAQAEQISLMKLKNAHAKGKLDRDIDNLEATVNTGSNSNEKLRKAITDLQTLTGDANKGNNALATKLTTLAGVVEHSTTGLAATKAIADEALDTAKDNDARLSAIEGDYLKAADTYIFNCGSSSLVIHK